MDMQGDEKWHKKDKADSLGNQEVQSDMESPRQDKHNS